MKYIIRENGRKAKGCKIIELIMELMEKYNKKKNNLKYIGTMTACLYTAENDP